MVKVSYVSIGKRIDKFIKQEPSPEKELDWIEKIIEKTGAKKTKIESLFKQKKKNFEEIKIKKQQKAFEKLRALEQKKEEEINKKIEAELLLQKKKRQEKEKEKAIKEALLLEKAIQDLEKIKENEINWFETDYPSNYDECKSYAKHLWGHKKEYCGEDTKWFFPAHSSDSIKGKPQLIKSVQTQLPLVRLAINKCKSRIDPRGFEEIKSFFFIDEKFDKRHDGFQKDIFSKYFWMYKVTSQDKKEYFVLSNEILPNEVCTFEGMILEMPDFAELSRNLKLPSISSFFFVKNFIPSIKVIPPEKLIEFVQEKEISLINWLTYLKSHPLGTFNNFPIEIELLDSSQILSGKIDKWPMHRVIFGPPGSGKSMGYIENIAHKFDENSKIAEASMLRLKALIPSYKGNVPELGYLIQSNRMGFVDEIGKMVEKELVKHDSITSNVLGDFNAIMEHKQREGGSGNTGLISMQATAKYLKVTNPVSKRKYVSNHIDLFDATYLSRCIIWVQDEEEQELAMSKDGILRDACKSLGGKEDVSPNTFTSVTLDKALKESENFNVTNILIENRKKEVSTKKSWGKNKEYVLGLGECGGESRDIFLTLFDSCYSFVSEIEQEKVNQIFNDVLSLTKEPMKSYVWKPRGRHHVALLIDGLCKTRCLFIDHDSSFKANEQDYFWARRILKRMVKGWDTNLSRKEDLT